MKMDGNIRVRISKEYEQVYNSLSKGIGIDSHILFFICFCIAISKELTPNPIKSRIDRFWSKTFTPQEWTSMYSVILAQNGVNLKSVENDEDIVRQAEALSNAGMTDLLQNIPSDYIRKNDDVLSFAIDDKGEAIKDMLFLLLEIYFNQEEQQ